MRERTNNNNHPDDKHTHSSMEGIGRHLRSLLVGFWKHETRFLRTFGGGGAE